MKVSYKTRNGQFVFELEGANQKDLFEQIANVQELYEGLTASYNGKTSDRVNLRVREVDGNKFYEAVCVDEDKDLRNARLSFGVNKVGGGLFPKRKNDDGSYNANNGWKKWNGEKEV